MHILSSLRFLTALRSVRRFLSTSAALWPASGAARCAPEQPRLRNHRYLSCFGKYKDIPVLISNRGIISYYISIFQERIVSPVKSELYVIQERIVDGSDWLICSAECLTNSKWSHDKTCQSELSIIRSWGPIICSWGPIISSWGITLAGMFFLTYIIAYRTSICLHVYEDFKSTMTQNFEVILLLKGWKTLWSYLFLICICLGFSIKQHICSYLSDSCYSSWQSFNNIKSWLMQQ